MAEPSPKITVLIPTFDRGRYIAECLDSILGQTLPAAQIIVVNDGSTDRTVEALGPYRQRIDYFETAQLGKAAAINRGLESAVGDYLWIFDDDDVALPDALERFVRPLETQPRYGFSYSTFFYTGTRPDGDRIGPVLHELEIPDLEKRGFLVPLLENNFLGGAALFARMSCYREVGVFDPALVRSQDYEMAIRIARRFSGVRVPGPPTFHYRQHEGHRGSMADRFAADVRFQKWLEYDQLIFRKLYRELPLGAYLPPGVPPEDAPRQALLQRLTVMASKLLMPEVTKDFEELAKLADPGPLSENERLAVQVLVRCWYNRMRYLADHREFPDLVRRLSASSKTAALVRGEILRAVLRFYWEKPGLQRFRESVPRLLHLYR